MFDLIRDKGTIRKYLEAAYRNPEAFDDGLVNAIRACTEGRGGHAAFASIMWSPPASSSFSPPSEGEERDGGGDDDAAEFYSNLSRVPCDVLLVFGRDDPWCRPAFAVRMCETLRRRRSGKSGSSGATTTTTAASPICRYVDLDGVGHCPNHEAPRSTGRAIRRWTDAGGEGGGGRATVPLVVGTGKEEGEKERGGGDGRDAESVEEPSWGGEVIMREMMRDEASSSSSSSFDTTGGAVDKILARMI